MPHSSKPIVCICGSCAIDYVDLDRYINPNHCGEIISGKAFGIENLAKQWAYKYKLEYIDFQPNYEIWNEKALLERDKDMILFCDVVIVFWDGKSLDMINVFKYAQKLNRQLIIHKIISTD